MYQPTPAPRAVKKPRPEELYRPEIVYLLSYTGRAAPMESVGAVRKD